MAEFEKTCKTCRYGQNNNIRCYVCERCSGTYKEWDCEDWLKEWLSSFDTNSATECFTAVNLLKQRLEEDK